MRAITSFRLFAWSVIVLVASGLLIIAFPNTSSAKPIGPPGVKTVPGATAAVCVQCATPYSKPDLLLINGLPKGSLNLSGPIRTYPGEQVQGGWATNIIQTNTFLTPDTGELARLSQPLDMLFGEALTDATWLSPEPATHAKNPSVIFQVPISYTGTGLQFTGPNYVCYAEACVPPYISDGLYAVYFARVEDCLSSTDKVNLKQVMDNQNNPIPCSTADGIPGNSGTWYDIAPPWGATASLKMNPIEKMTTDTVAGVLKVPAQLPVPVNSVRIEIMLGLQDGDGGWINSVYWGVVDENSSTVGPFSGPEHALTRIALQLPNVTVLPAAFVQMKVLPYTIVYRPPGDQSSGTYTATQAYGTTMTVGNSTTIDNSENFMTSYGVKNGDSVTALVATVDLQDGQSISNATGWDNNTLIGTGLTVANSHQTVRSFTVGATTTDNSILPASQYVVPNSCGPTNYTGTSCTVEAPETYQQEPFWADRIVLLLDPQAALWDFNGTPSMQLLGASNFDEISVRDLDTCAQNTSQNAWKLSNGQYLTPSECHDLVSLDPFYGVGQWISPGDSGRGLSVGSGTYGRDPLNPASPSSAKFSDIFTYQTQQSTSGTATYSTTVTDILAFSWSEGLSLSYKYSMYGLNVGFNASTTLTQGEQTTTGLTMKVSYSNSTVATSTNATEIDGIFGDDHDFYTPDCQQNSGNCYTPAVHVYLDELFGSYMFEDTDAPCGSTDQNVCSKQSKLKLLPLMHPRRPPALLPRARATAPVRRITPVAPR